MSRGRKKFTNYILMKIFVGGIPFSASNEDLKKLFEKFGQVESAEIVIDRFSGRSRGFGFVVMPHDEEARTAIEKLNNTELEGRKLTVNTARPLK